MSNENSKVAVVHVSLMLLELDDRETSTLDSICVCVEADGSSIMLPAIDKMVLINSSCPEVSENSASVICSRHGKQGFATC